MGVFSRISDIINSNLNVLLDKAEDPEKLVRLIIEEMEQTLVEVRSASAKTLAEKKELTRHMTSLANEIKQWEQNAELAIQKGREDLAKAALAEKHRLSVVKEAQNKEMNELETAIQRLEVDVSKLQSKRNEAVARRDAMILRQQTLQKHKAVRSQINTQQIDHALSKFSAFEQKMDLLEAEVEAMSLGQCQSLHQQFDDLVLEEKLSEELEALKKKVTKSK